MQTLDELSRRLRMVVAQIENPGPALKLIALLGIRSVQNNFRAQRNADGSPWPRLKYRIGTPLVDKIGRMPKGVAARIDTRSVVVGAGYATRAYNAIHNFGGQAGRGLKTHIPQRQYMYFSRKDREAMVNEVRRFVSRSLGGA